MNIQRTILVFVLVIALFVTQQGVALGDGPESRTEAPMVLQCDQLTGKALKYAKEHNLCPSKQGGGERYGEAVGDCGLSWIDISDIGGGWARFQYGVNSSQGAIAKIDYIVSWNNWDTGGGANFGGTEWVWGNPWSASRDQKTNAGFVTGTLGGTVTLWWGGTCAILNPTDEERIE